MRRKVDEQQVAVARVYARSLLELALERGSEREILDQLRQLGGELDREPSFERYLGDPGVDEGDRGQAIARILRGRADDLVVDTLLVMNRKGRGKLVRALVQAYTEELEKLEGVVEVEAVTAVPLGDAARRRLEKALAQHTGKKVLLEESVEPALLGGMVLRIGDRKIDSSVSRELARLRHRLLERAAERLHAGDAISPAEA